MDAGAAFQPQKLYFNVFPRGWLKLAVKLMPLFGQDPHRFGRNHDIDIASLAQTDFPVHARVRLAKRSAAIRAEAIACYKKPDRRGPAAPGSLPAYQHILRTEGLLYTRLPGSERVAARKRPFRRRHLAAGRSGVTTQHLFFKHEISIAGELNDQTRFTLAHNHVLLTKVRCKERAGIRMGSNLLWQMAMYGNRKLIFM